MIRYCYFWNYKCSFLCCFSLFSLGIYIPGRIYKHWIVVEFNCWKVTGHSSCVVCPQLGIQFTSYVSICVKVLGAALFYLFYLNLFFNMKHVNVWCDSALETIKQSAFRKSNFHCYALLLCIATFISFCCILSTFLFENISKCMCVHVFIFAPLSCSKSVIHYTLPMSFIIIILWGPISRTYYRALAHSFLISMITWLCVGT